MTDLTQLLSDLVAIDSQNPGLVPAAAGEAEIAAYIARICTEMGLDVQLQESAPGRPNVIATRRGAGGGRSMLLNGHMDTVDLGGMEGPLSPRVENGRLYGRGAYDMKASLAAMLLAVETLSGDELRGDLILTFVTDEEYASVGTETSLRAVTADAAIITEPTDLTLTIAHKGFVWAQIETRGRAAHGSRPDEGIDAITAMGPILTALAAHDAELQAGAAHPLVGPASVHASLITGGTGLSTYPDRCLLDLERRTIPGETKESVRAGLEAILAACRDADPRLDVRLSLGLSRSPYEIAPAHELARLTSKVAEHVTGSAPELTGGSGWMDSALLGAAGIPTVIFGPTGEGAHSDIEWVDLASVKTCVDVYAALAREWCA